MMSAHSHEHGAGLEFPTETAGLPQAAGSQVVDLSDGDAFTLRIAPVAKRLGEATVRMLAYNGSIRPDAQGAAGLGGPRHRGEPGRLGDDRALARPSPRPALGRDAG